MKEPIRVVDLSHALEKLRELGVPYDRLYVGHYTATDFFGHERSSQGIHIYINNGFDCNVAYFTPTMGTLSILDGCKGRVDGTPAEKRKPYPMPIPWGTQNDTRESGEEK